MPEPKILLSGLGIPESPRWHEGRLWFCNWIDRQVMAVDMDAKAEVMLTRDPASHSMGWSIDWLPDGRLLTTGDKIWRQEPDGSMAVHADQPAARRPWWWPPLRSTCSAVPWRDSSCPPDSAWPSPPPSSPPASHPSHPPQSQHRHHPRP
jgi:hypothetical protein